MPMSANGMVRTLARDKPVREPLTSLGGSIWAAVARRGYMDKVTYRLKEPRLDLRRTRREIPGWGPESGSRARMALASRFGTACGSRKALNMELTCFIRMT